MKRRRSPVGLIAAGAGLSLAGLLLVQILLVRRNLEWKSQAFRQDVAGALASVVEKLETREALKRIWTVSFMNKGDEAYALLNDDARRSTMFALGGGVVPKVQTDGGYLVLVLSVPQRVRLVVVEPAGKADWTVLDDILPAGQTRIQISQAAAGAPQGGGTRWLKLFLDEIPYDLTLRDGKIVSILAHPTIDQSRAALIDKILEQYLLVRPAPLEQRIDAAELKAAVDESLRERKIPGACVYGVLPAGSGEVLLASDPARKDELLRTEFRTRLFPHDISVAAGDLAFVFPAGEGSLPARLGGTALVAVLFILGAAACLYLVLRAAAGQKRAAEAMADFVANMTHEFKTPISTISLAAEALGQPAVRDDEVRRAKYRDMIGAECRRMRGQIRKILETAALEKGDLELRFAPLDVRDMILQTAEAFKLAAEGRGGAITTKLDGAPAFIDADPVHFPNVLRNLVDNAVQYTRRPPDIVISARAEGDGLRIAVSDNGLGLSPENRKRVFEKYFRVPTGNVHDVKGFGLGLSYAQLIVRAHGGTIGVQSEEGRGSTFEIALPLRRSAPGNSGEGRIS